MEFDIIILIEISIISILIFFIIWKLIKNRVGKPYQFEIIFMKPGVNPHIFIRKENLNFEYEYNGKIYKIESERLYRVKPGIFRRIFFRIVGIRTRFIIAFQYGKVKPIKPIKVKVSSRVIHEVKDSRALSKAMTSEFHVPMDLKKILIIIGFIVVVVAAYLVVTGEVVI